MVSLPYAVYVVEHENCKEISDKILVNNNCIYNLFFSHELVRYAALPVMDKEMTYRIRDNCNASVCHPTFVRSRF